MAARNVKCPHCSSDLSLDEGCFGMQVTCPLCNRSFVIPSPAPAPQQYGQQPQYTQPQYGQQQYTQSQYGQQPQYTQPQYGQQPQYTQPQYGQQPQYTQPQQYGAAPMNYSVPTQGVGERFQLMPGEVMIHQEKMTRLLFIRGATEMRVTNQRLVFCHTSRALTHLVSWLFWYMGSSKISQTFTRADIAEMHLEKTLLGRKKVILTDLKGEKFKYMGNGFSNAAADAIMQWYNAPR